MKPTQHLNSNSRITKKLTKDLWYMDCQELTLMSMLFETTPCKSCPTETPYQNFALDLAKQNANYKDNNEIMGKTEDTCEFSYNVRLDKVVDDAKDI